MGLIRFIGDRYVCNSSDAFPNVLDGALLTTVDTFKQYIRQNGNWQMLSGSQLVSGFSNIVRLDYQVPSGGIASGIPIPIPGFTVYDSGRNRLEVHRDGIYQTKNSGWFDNDFEELNNTGIYMSMPLPSGCRLTFTIYSKDSSITT